MDIFNTNFPQIWITVTFKATYNAITKSILLIELSKIITFSHPVFRYGDAMEMTAVPESLCYADPVEVFTKYSKGAILASEALLRENTKN